MLMINHLIGFGASSDVGSNHIQTTSATPGASTNFGAQNGTIGDKSLSVVNTSIIYRLGLYCNVGASRTINIRLWKLVSGDTYDEVATTGSQTHTITGWEWFNIVTPPYDCGGSGTFMVAAYVVAVQTFSTNPSVSNEELFGSEGTGAGVVFSPHTRDTFAVGYET